MKQKHMGWFVIAIVALIAYFVFKKAKPVGGVTSTGTVGYGASTSGLYSQVG